MLLGRPVIAVAKALFALATVILVALYTAFAWLVRCLLSPGKLTLAAIPTQILTLAVGLQPNPTNTTQLRP